MAYFITSDYVNAITSAICCIFVFSSNLKSKVNRSFAYFAFSIALWAAMRPLWMIGPDKNEVLFTMRISMIAAAFIPVTFFHFAIRLIDKFERYSKMLYFLYVISFLISFTGFTPLYVKEATPHLFFKFYPTVGPTFTLMTLEFQFSVIYGLTLIYNELNKVSGQKYHQMKLVFYGILLTYIGGFTNFPLVYNIPLPPIGDILVSSYTLFILYAIFRYQLMDIHFILRRSLLYTILITIVTILYMAFIYITEHEVQTIIGYKSLLVSTTFAVLIALIFIPLKNFIQNFIEKTLFRGNYVEIVEQNDFLRQEIMQTEKLKSVAILASGIAHEIKNPLTPIKTFSEELPKRLNDKEFLLKFSKLINHEVNRIDTLVQELLTFAKPSPPQLKQTNIHQLIGQTLELLNNEIIRHKINLETSFESKDILINADAQQIKQALLNIFLNAIDVMPNGGILRVDTKLNQDNTGLILSISDTGHGIAPKDLPHIFDPFFTKKDQGTGLGLSITYEIIKSHNGKILAESQEGKGTTFTIELPV